MPYEHTFSKLLWSVTPRTNCSGR